MGSNRAIPIPHGKQNDPKLASAGLPLYWQVLGQDLFETTNQDMSGQFTYSISNDSRARFMKFMPMCGGSPHQPSFIGRDLENYDPDLHKPIVHHDSKRLTPMDDE